MQDTSVQSNSRPQTRSEVLEILCANANAIRDFGATAMYLFGSAARDELTADSDIDLFVDYDPTGSFGFVELFELKDFLAGKLDRTVDLTSRSGLHPRLKARIERSSVKVF